MTEFDPTNKMGKIFIWLAWCFALALLVFFFQDVLDKQWDPNKDPQMNLNSQGKAEVTLQQDRQGHYVVHGEINELPVVFLLDTGATQVSIPAHIAEELQLKGYGSSRVNTANGTTTVYQTKLQQLSIGNIYLYDVAAHINPSMQSNQILLGMSALKRVEFSQVGKQLILRER
ncbi:MAG: aspartyl protease family protein [Colwellia sp.]|jgi:aspartyl protease family protein